VPEHLLGERISQGDRVVLLDERQATGSSNHALFPCNLVV